MFDSFSPSSRLNCLSFKDCINVNVRLSVLGYLKVPDYLSILYCFSHSDCFSVLSNLSVFDYSPVSYSKSFLESFFSLGQFVQAVCSLI